MISKSSQCSPAQPGCASVVFNFLFLRQRLQVVRSTSYTHCNTCCNTRCNTHCNTHCNTRYNTHCKFTACKRCRKNQKLKRIVETKEKSKKRVGDENWLENLYWQIVQWWRKVIEWSLLRKVITFSEESALRYGVATTCRLFKIIGLFCKRAL